MDALIDVVHKTAKLNFALVRQRTYYVFSKWLVNFSKISFHYFVFVLFDNTTEAKYYDKQWKINLMNELIDVVHKTAKFELCPGEAKDILYFLAND